MYIEKLIIENYKGFSTRFELDLNEGVNIIVGNNEAGKSTILEAINLALTGVLNGKYIKNHLSQYLFNKDVEQSYIESFSGRAAQEPPMITIEVYFHDGPALFNGNGNLLRSNSASGIRFRIEFDSEYQEMYDALVASENPKNIPIEYYKVSWKSFARSSVTGRVIEYKSALIDSTATKFHNGSDVYISRIVRNRLETEQKVQISQAYRKLKEGFAGEDSIKAINESLNEELDISDRELSISVDFATKDAWEFGLTTYVDSIPFHFIGKGEQCIIKTNLSLTADRAQNAGIILLEEPENHLSHSKLNQFIKSVTNSSEGKQILISTHESFVANKLGLSNLILLAGKNTTRLNELDAGTQDFFKKLPGYQTLRMILCKKVILVEGDSDELIVQRAYMDSHEGKLPIEDGIDVISVKLTFKRFLFIAQQLNIPAAVVTDNDKDYAKNIERKYAEFEDCPTIDIIADRDEELHTLEPQFVRANNDDLEKLRDLVGLNAVKYDTEKKISKKFTKMKTKWAFIIRIILTERFNGVMSNKLVIAAAGSGKTTFLVNQALEDSSKRVLITTYTENNGAEIRKKIFKAKKCIPSNITVQSWFSFLIQHGIKPHLGSLHDDLVEEDLKGLHFSMTSSSLKRTGGGRSYRVPEAQTKRYYLDSGLRVYSDKAAKMAVKIDVNCEGASVNRIAKLFDLICIDEIQDLAGYDLDYIKLLFATESEVLLVGDPRQVTYVTHHENRHNAYRDGRIKEFCENECGGGNGEVEVDETTLQDSHRNPQSICEVANKLYPGLSETNACECCDRNGQDEGHIGVYLVKPVDITAYLSLYPATILRWDVRKEVEPGYLVANMGESKGQTMDRVLIYPTEPIHLWITDHTNDLANGARAKFYVALTRARYSSAIVFDFKDGTDYPGFIKFQLAQ
jgi:putative ATP-dependent endonuclease of OLD family